MEDKQTTQPIGYFQRRKYGAIDIIEQVVDSAKDDEGVFPLYAGPIQPAAPHILEALSWHARERDDLLLDDAVEVIRNGWKTIRGRTERQLALQIASLLAGAPIQPASGAPAVPDEKAIFDWLQRKYVQRADDRQKAMGLVYTEAETHDLARELARLCAAPSSPAVPVSGAVEMTDEKALRQFEETLNAMRDLDVSAAFHEIVAAARALLSARTQAGQSERIEYICDAYESGFGHGLKRDGLRNGAEYYASSDSAKAYTLGYAAGEERAQSEAPIAELMALYRSVKESNEQVALDMEPLFIDEIAAIDLKLNPDLVEQATQQSERPDAELLADARNTILWLERRLPKGYGEVPHVRRMVDALNRAIVAAPNQAQSDKKDSAPLSIKTWQERCNWTSDEPATKLMVEAMKAEIADLRAAIEADKEGAGD